MKLILAQGNPGADYRDTRHNIVFQLIDAYADTKGVSFIDKPKFHAAIAELSTTKEKIILVKPLTFYNETGLSARTLADFYKLDPAEDVLVIHDDIALPFGMLRTREKGSDAGNNGIKSLNAHLGDNYKRIRVGIHSELADRMDTSAFVLGTLSAEERTAVATQLKPEVVRIIDTFINGSFQSTSI